MGVKQIITGHLNELTGDNQELHDTRYKICEGCPKLKSKRIGKLCGVCGCRLQAKLRVEREVCPLDKW